MTFFLFYLFHYESKKTRSFVVGGLEVLVNWEEYLPYQRRRGLSFIEYTIGRFERNPGHGRVDRNVYCYPYGCQVIWRYVKLGLNVRYKETIRTSKELILQKRCWFDPTKLSTKVLRLGSDRGRSIAHYNTHMCQVWFINRLKKMGYAVINWRLITFCWTHIHPI